MKTYTDFEQSKKLAEILPSEPYYCNIITDTGEYDKEPMFHNPVCEPDKSLPCWSLAALLDILPVGTETHKQTYDSIECYYVEVYNNRKYFCTDRYVNLLDACVKMIFALKQRNLL